MHDEWKAMAHGAIEAVWNKSSEAIKSTVIKQAKKKLEQYKVDLGIAFAAYLEKSYEKYSHAKTLLYRDRPRPIREFFVVPTLRADKKDRPITVNSSKDIFRCHNFIIIKGTGGIGKSMLMKHLFLSELDNKGKIPVLFELKDINDQKEDYELIDVLFEKLGVLGTSATKYAIEYALEQGLFLLLLDGYDEIRSEKAIDFVKKLNDFCDKYTKNYVAVSTRPSGEFLEFGRFAVLETTGLDKEQALELLGRLDYDKDSKERFIFALDEVLYDEHKSFASNPLLLTMMFLTYDDYAGIPEKLHLFYERAFETLLTRHDSTKEGYKRKLESGLPPDSFKKVFACFCCLTYYSNELEFAEDKLKIILKKARAELESREGIGFETASFIRDLVDAVCMLYKEGSHYSFVHRSFQEYFTAVYLKDQSDDVMERRGMQIINHNPSGALTDNVFGMLGDMERSKLEKNIILPLLKKVELDFVGSDKYSFYFNRVVSSVSIDTFGVGMSYRADPAFNLLHSSGYFSGDSMYIFEADKKLEEYLRGDTCHGEISETIICSIDEIKADNELYRLVKDTWIGRAVLRLSTLRDELEKKYAPMANSEDDFFII